MDCLQITGYLPGANASSLAILTKDSGKFSKWNCKVAAPPERPPQRHKQTPLQEEFLQYSRRRELPPLRQEPAWENWSRQEATENNLIFRVMFAEEPKRPGDAGYNSKESYRTRCHSTSSEQAASTLTLDPDLKSVCASYGGVTKRIKLQQGCSDDMAEQLVRDAFDLCADRVICLRNKVSGAVTAANTKMADGEYEVITDEDQDVAGHLPVVSLYRSITRTASKEAVKDALKHCGLSQVLPQLKRMSGAKLLSMPLDALQAMYSLSGWRLRAIRSLYNALHPPVRITIKDSIEEGAAETVRVANAKGFSELLSAHGCVALRAQGSGSSRKLRHLAVRFEDLREGNVYSPVCAQVDLYACVE